MLLPADGGLWETKDPDIHLVAGGGYGTVELLSDHHNQQFPAQSERDSQAIGY